jgi:hypothetical protein
VSGHERTYHGERNASTDHPADRGELLVYVRERGAIRPLRHVIFHSSGLEWGYTGAGPGDLALSLLADALDLSDQDAIAGEPRRAHQAFKRQVVGRLAHQGWSLSRSDVLDWLSRWREHGPLPSDTCEVCGRPGATVRDGETAWCDSCWEVMGGPARQDG